jgi:hypothetical protein
MSGAPEPVADRLALRITDRAAHAVLSVGRSAIHTDDNGGRLAVLGLMPADERRDLMGRPLDRVFHHPAVVGEAYVIQLVELDEARNRTLFRFAAAPVEWRMPWARPWERYR